MKDWKFSDKGLNIIRCQSPCVIRGPTPTLAGLPSDRARKGSAGYQQLFAAFPGVTPFNFWNTHKRFLDDHKSDTFSFVMEKFFRAYRRYLKVMFRIGL